MLFKCFFVSRCFLNTYICIIYFNIYLCMKTIYYLQSYYLACFTLKKLYTTHIEVYAYAYPFLFLAYLSTCNTSVYP